MSRSVKACSPPALAGANGLSTTVEGADRPTPHDSKFTSPRPQRQRRFVVMVWRGGLLPMGTHHPSLPLWQLALLARANCARPA